MMMTAARPGRGRTSGLRLRTRRVRYAGNGLRSVPLEETLAAIEKFLLEHDDEVQFEIFRRDEDGATRAALQDLTPLREPLYQRYSGKGISSGQALASAFMEFIERLAARAQPRARLVEASFGELASDAVDPRLFSLSSDAAWDADKKLDWVSGYSLTRSRPVLVPANLVFAPYLADQEKKYICLSDSNGLASGNNLEEAVLHGLMEVVERDAAMIGEYNRLGRPEFAPEGLPPDVLGLAGLLSERGYRCSFRNATTDIPVPAVSAFLQNEADPSLCCVAFGCDLDPQVAFSRALTEAVQLLPPSYNQKEWLESGSPEHYAAPSPVTMRPTELPNAATDDLKRNIEICVAALEQAGSEVIVVDLSLPDVPFPAVRVLATGLQPIVRQDDLRLSPRFFHVPVKLGLREGPSDPSRVRFWPLCGYR